LFSERFAFSLPALVNFVGGGGKTGLILDLLEEYSETIPAMYTTTTRIHPPHPSDGLAVLSSDNLGLLKMLLERAAAHWCCHRRFVVTSLSREPNLLRGVDADFGRMVDPSLIPLILNEADGARSMSLKVPRSGEPVLMTGAQYLVPVIGMDVLNQPAGPDSIFRWELASTQFDLKRGAILDPEMAAGILFHPQGVCRDWQPGMTIIPFINKVDEDADEDAARALASALHNNGRFPVKRVVWGSIRHGTADGIIF
jgi:probable selenium-dependent hydroxylase accessory protein YqeC